MANPGSGRDTDPDELAEALRARGADVDPHPIDDVEAAERSARDRDRLVVAGGDGSIGLCAACRCRAGVPLAVIPTGTANDFARAMDLPLDRERALDARREPRRCRCARIELLRAGDRPFVNAATAGLAVIAAHRARPLKPRLGPLAYAVGRASARASPRTRSPSRSASTASEAFHGDAWQVIVGGTGAFGGGCAASARPDPTDELLDVAIVSAARASRLIRRASGMRRGHARASRTACVHVRAAHVEIDVARRRPSSTSTGRLCALQPVTFTSSRAACEVVVPR